MNILLFLFISAVYSKECYWNNQFSYALYGTKTPYNSARGDIRDHRINNDCEAISVWSMYRHGNRNPGKRVIAEMKQVLGLKDEIIASYEAGNSQLCAQDIENLKMWHWQSSIDDGHFALTKSGYEELYGIGKRFAEKYRNLLQGTADKFYFRSTTQQRTITSCEAFINGVIDRIPLNVTIDKPRTNDDVLGPYEMCERYKQEVRNGTLPAKQEDMFKKSSECVAVVKAVQQRLGIPTILTADQVLGMYLLCSYYRSWTKTHQSPWCAVFSNEDLVVMEYFDDVSTYYKKGYGSWINVYLGEAPLRNLYEHFETVLSGKGKKLVAYFSHDSMMQMMFCALGLYLDSEPITGSSRNPNRRWRCSFFGAYSSNLIAVLNRCRSGYNQEYRVQFFINELTTKICPPEGCSWMDFQNKLRAYMNSNLNFCNMSIPEILYRRPKDIN